LVITQECFFDKHLPEFREIVSLAKDYYKDPKMQRMFSVDFGLIPALCCVVKMCRDWAVRREAIALLRSAAPRREGIWKSSLIVQASLIAAIREWIMGIEEEGIRERCFIPEYSRVRLSKTKVDVKSNTARVECVKRRSAEEGGGVIHKEATLSW
jgi:hypothetical protein